MSDAHLREVRYERKLLVQGVDAGQVRMLVRRHPGMFYEPYPPRMVNNLYLDTEELENYAANVSGVGERRKVRTRWYGEMFGEVTAPKLEVKVRHGAVGEKYSYDFPAFVLAEGFSQRAFQGIVQGSDLPEGVRRRLRSLQVVLANRYLRWYYASRDGRWRITVDTGMTYWQVKRECSRFRVKFVDRGRVVVELKYGVGLDPQAGRIAGFFPFGVTRHSKYVTGIERVYV